MNHGKKHTVKLVLGTCYEPNNGELNLQKLHWKISIYVTTGTIRLNPPKGGQKFLKNIYDPEKISEILDTPDNFV